MPMVLIGCLVAGGCGEDDPYADYCAEVEAQQKSLTEAKAAEGQLGLIEGLASFEALEKEAPDDIEDEWATVTGRIGDLVAAYDAAGVEPADYDPKDPPAGVSKDEERQIAAAAGALTAPEMVEAFEGVQQQALDVCTTPLSL